MDRDQVDRWVSGVDALLAGRRDDDSVSDDAMRWAPDEPPVSLPSAVLDVVQVRLRIDPQVFIEAMRRVMDEFRRFYMLTPAVLDGAEPQRVVMDETYVFTRDDERVRRVIEMQRNRDTGPALPPLGRRGR